jgi:hypothetical protein
VTPDAVAAWPLRDGLCAWVELLKDRALADFRHAERCYYAVAPYLKDKQDPPKPPPILDAE